MATADQNQDLPEGCAPLGSIHAYSKAHAAQLKKNANSIEAHLAGLRAVVLNDRQQRAEAAADVPSMESGSVSELRLTESDWRLREELRQHWSTFCDADPVPEDFVDRMEDAGFVETRKVTRGDLEDSFAAERGIEKGGYVWCLTKLGHEVLDNSPQTQEQP